MKIAKIEKQNIDVIYMDERESPGTKFIRFSPNNNIIKHSNLWFKLHCDEFVPIYDVKELEDQYKIVIDNDFSKNIIKMANAMMKSDAGNKEEDEKYPIVDINQFKSENY